MFVLDFGFVQFISLQIQLNWTLEMLKTFLSIENCQDAQDCCLTVPVFNHELSFVIMSFCYSPFVHEGFPLTFQKHVSKWMARCEMHA